jgi:tryptophan synthase alpha chain
MRPRDRIRDALARDPRKGERPALVAYITAGFPEPREFLKVLESVGSASDAIEIGVPFSDPMADGVTIQRSSRHAIGRGVSLRWILDELARRDYELPSPVLLMSYLNPLLAFGGESKESALGYGKLAARAAEVGVSGFIVPDLPYEESAPLRAALDGHGLALVQLVTPATPPERLRALCLGSQGFVYAVTRTGITGAESTLPAETARYLAAVKAASELPVCAGFGVRRAEQVATIAKHSDGVIVGSALIEVLERGEDPAQFLRSLRASAMRAQNETSRAEGR